FVIAAIIVGGLVWTLITIALLRYRRRPGDEATVPPQIGHITWLEVLWTAVPIVTILILFGLTLSTLGKVDAQAATRVTVDVTGFRWQWRFDYEGTPVSIVGGPETSPEMVVPVGEPIHIVLNAADVDHSFYVPAFLFKRDAIPGKPNAFDLTITEPGVYSGQCAEFCGVFHARMTLTVRAVSRPEFDAWLVQQQSGVPSAAASPSNSPAPPAPASNPAAPSSAAEASTTSSSPAAASGSTAP
ncbi:MAG TPA: cytochrome c oxidase subunit II, partial [Candidatus Limnocylindrales bacterium]|nr:cytochrome c oxidase subunit II [Candidatus Limnocylindrales bacterium]